QRLAERNLIRTERSPDVQRGAVGEAQEFDAVQRIGPSLQLDLVGELPERNAGMRGVLDADGEVGAGDTGKLQADIGGADSGTERQRIGAGVKLSGLIDAAAGRPEGIGDEYRVGVVVEHRVRAVAAGKGVGVIAGAAIEFVVAAAAAQDVAAVLAVKMIPAGAAVDE